MDHMKLKFLSNSIINSDMTMRDSGND